MSQPELANRTKQVKTIKNIWLQARLLVCLVMAFLVSAVASFASTDPEDIITAADGKYNAAVAIFIAAAVIGAGILYIRKGLRGRM